MATATFRRATNDGASDGQYMQAVGAQAVAPCMTGTSWSRKGGRQGGGGGAPRS